jgi:Prophage protein (DUF1660)
MWKLICRLFGHFWLIKFEPKPNNGNDDIRIWICKRCGLTHKGWLWPGGVAGVHNLKNYKFMNNRVGPGI